MNLEQIDTSTTAGKARVMQLASEGRKVAARRHGEEWIVHHEPHWDWYGCDYAIIAEPVGPDEVWVAVGFCDGSFTKEAAEKIAADHPGATVARYRRADLAGEVKP